MITLTVLVVVASCFVAVSTVVGLGVPYARWEPGDASMVDEELRLAQLLPRSMVAWSLVVCVVGALAQGATMAFARPGLTIRAVVGGIALITGFILAVSTIILTERMDSSVVMWDGMMPDGTPTGGMERQVPAAGLTWLIVATYSQVGVLMLLLVQVGVQGYLVGSRQRFNRA